MTFISPADLAVIKPVENLKLKGRGKAKTISIEQLNELLELLPDFKFVSIFGLAYCCGARITEILSLTRDQITEEHIYIRTLKQKKLTYRAVPVTATITRFIDLIELPDSGYVYPGRHNTKSAKPSHLTRQAADSALRRATEQAGIIGVSTHSFRRSMATHLSNVLEWSDSQIARQLGHTSTETTKGYIDKLIKATA